MIRGDKVRLGDGRTPEGVFHICSKKLDSQYERFLGIDYPTPEVGLLAGVDRGGPAGVRVRRPSGRRPARALAEVEARRERSPFAGDDHDRCRRPVEPLRRLGDLGKRHRAQRVELVGLVQGEPADAAVDRCGEGRPFGHVAIVSAHSDRHRIRRAATGVPPRLALASRT